MDKKTLQVKNKIIYLLKNYNINYFNDNKPFDWSIIGDIILLLLGMVITYLLIITL